jgi:hypothetical protein
MQLKAIFSKFSQIPICGEYYCVILALVYHYLGNRWEWSAMHSKLPCCPYLKFPKMQYLAKVNDEIYASCEK